MIQFTLAALIAYLTVRAHRSAAARDERALSFARVRFAFALAVLVAALVPLAYGAAPAARLAILAVGAVAGVAAWEAFAQLLATGMRKRDMAPRSFWLGVAVITLATPAPWGVSAAFGLLGGMAFRWRHAVPTRRKYLLVIVAIVLASAGYFRIGTLAGVNASNTLTALEGQLWSFANSIRLALAMICTFGAWTLLLAIVGDPSLGIRTVGRRLALSHLLVVLIPLTLLLILWTATTVLGVNGDRAHVAARAMGAQERQLHAGLERALATSPESAPLAALAAAWGGDAMGARAYLWQGGRIKQVAGESLAGADIAAQAWLDSLDALPASALITLDGRVWVAAAMRRGAHGAFVMVNADSIIRQYVAKVAGGVTLVSTSNGGVIVPEREAADSLLGALRSATESDSIAGEESTDRADSAARNVVHTSVSVGGKKFRVDNPNMSARQFLLEGHAFVPALGWQKSGHWKRGQLMLSVGVPPSQALRGLYQNSQNDPMGYVPLVLLIMLGVLMALVALWDALMVTSMSRGVASAIGALRDAARKLEGGDLTHRIELRGDDDLWDVARAVNQAAEGLERAQTAEKDRARMESELAVARRIQARLLPEGPPSIAGLEIAGASEAAREVGGDYFDHIDMGDGRVALVIADVSGKGVPAALLMSAFRAALISHDLRREEPAALAERLNVFLHGSVESGKFVTAFIGFLDSASGELHYVNAGHNPSLLTRADGTHEWLSQGGTILGILPMSVFTAGRATLQYGDVLTLYTDGVTEGADASNEQWGEDRLVEALGRLREKPCAEVARALVTEVRAFEGDTGPADDLTVVVARRTK